MWKEHELKRLNKAVDKSPWGSNNLWYYQTILNVTFLNVLNILRIKIERYYNKSTNLGFERGLLSLGDLTSGQ